MISKKLSLLMIITLAATLSLFIINSTAVGAIRNNNAATAGKKSGYWPTNGWKTSTPEAQGMDPAVMKQMDEYINNEYYNLKSVVVVRNGYIVFEKYYNGTKKDDKAGLFSATKTFIGALTGIAINDKYIKDVNRKMIDYFPEYRQKGADPRIGKITLENLLTMTSGFTWMDNYSMEQSETEGGIKYLFKSSFDSEPGKKFNYNSMCAHVLSAVITKTTKISASKYAESRLFKPLGIKDYTWPQAYGYSTGGWGLELKPRDMAKFGYLLLKKGMWDGKQIIPSKWVDKMTVRHNGGGMPHGEEYGYLCWVSSVGGHSSFFAGGFGGQFIYVVPDLNVVVAISSMADMHHEENRGILGRFIVPSIEKAVK